VTFPRTSARLIGRYTQLTGSLTWVSLFEREFALSYRLRPPSLGELALAFPCEHELKLENNELKRKNIGPESRDYNASKTHWSRLRNGKVCVTNNLLTQRVELRFPQLTDIRKHPLWLMLGNPFLTPHKLKKIITLVAPTLENKLFYVSDKRPKFHYMPLPWSVEHCQLVESLESFTLKLVLYRLKAIGKFIEEWPDVCLKDLALHLFRICARTPYNRVATRLIRLFGIFVHCNRLGSISESTTKQYLHDMPIDSVYQNIFQQFHPEPKIWANRYPTLDDYLQANQTLVQKFWDDCFPKRKVDLPHSNFSLEALFWSDRASKTWLATNTPKEDIFNRQSELFKEHRRYIIDGCQKKAW